MQTISVAQFVRGIRSIYTEKPLYEIGCDGSNGKCDNIGMIRGGLLRGGAVKVKGLKNLNQLHRTLIGIHPINPKALKDGDVVLRREANNYTDVGVVVSVSPLEIMHMTRVTIKKDATVDAWDEVGWLPYIAEEQGETVCVSSGNGHVRIFSEPNFASVLSEIPDGTEVKLFGIENMWARVSYNGMNAYALAKHIKQAEKKISDIDLEELEHAYEILGKFLGHIRETRYEEDKRQGLRGWRERHLRKKAKV